MLETQAFIVMMWAKTIEDISPRKWQIVIDTELIVRNTAMHRIALGEKKLEMKQKKNCLEDQPKANDK